MRDRIVPVFFVLSVLNAVLLGAAIWSASRPSWKQYQREFYRLAARAEPTAAAKEAVLDTRPALSQILLPGLGRVDRCTVCHLGVEDPALKDAPQPFTYHPDVGTHPPSRFGCTVCHGGDGLATELPAAHGRGTAGARPLLAREFLRASCGKCHAKGVPGAPELDEGRKLLDSHGCRGCHRLNGVGGTIGPDLSHEGSTRRDPLWLVKHFLDPRSVSPGSVMPDFHLTPDEAKSLSFYLLSHSGEEMAEFYTSRGVIPNVSSGRELFVEKNCLACHSVGGVGGTGGPDLAGTTERHSRQWHDEHFANPTLVVPGSAMPAYDLTPDQRTALFRFLAQVTPKEAQEIMALSERPASSEDAAVRAGARAFEHFGCAGCHGAGGKGGVSNPNTRGGVVPPLVHVADDYTKLEVTKIIRLGKTPQAVDPRQPQPPLYMPSWTGILSQEDVRNIVEYLWSLRPAGETRW